MIPNQIIQGDCLEVLKTLPDESVNCVITSPPYWALRDYGTAKWDGGNTDCDHKIPDNEQDPKYKQAGSHIFRFNRDRCYKCGAVRRDLQLGLEPTFREYITKLCDIFDEVKRILKKDGTCWVNLGDTYSATRWTGNGKGQPMNKFKDGHRDINPNKDSGLEDKTLCAIPSRFQIEMINRGWICRNEIIWHKPNCMPSSATDRFTVDYEKVFFFVKSKKYWFETQYEKYAESSDVRYRQALRSNKDYEVKLPYIKNTPYSGYKKGQGTVKSREGVSPSNHLLVGGNNEGRNKRCVWTIPTKPFKEAHFATYPENLIVPMIKAGCPVGGLVLDPFFGAGTTGLVAKKMKRNYIGIELSEEYIKIAEARLRAVQDTLL